MKTTIYILLFMAIAIPFSIQGQTTQEQLIGTWLFDDTTSFNNLSRETLVHFDSIPLSQVTQIKSLYVGRRVTFGPDGSYLQVLADGRSVGGTWSFNSSEKGVIITHPSGGQLTQIVRQISGNQLLLVPSISGNAIMLINQCYYTKL